MCESGTKLQDVFFDDLTITHIESPILQEDHYYPFGLTMRGLGKQGNNPWKYNGKEFQEDLDLGWYDYGARHYDPALGRFINIDLLADEFNNLSPYNFVYNNPIRFTDPTGLAPEDDVFLSEKGEEMFRVVNDKPDRTFLIKTTKTTAQIYTPDEIVTGNAGNSNPISKQAAKDTETQLKAGNVSGPHMNNLIQIENQDNRRIMADIVSKDDGSGGTKPSNNREFGGSNSNGGVVAESPPGAVVDPSKQSEASITHTTTSQTRSSFHSHPGGKVVIGPGVNTVGGTTRTFSFQQGPSSHDIKNSGPGINTQFGRGNGRVHFFNNTGVVGTLPFKRFVNPK